MASPWLTAAAPLSPPPIALPPIAPPMAGAATNAAGATTTRGRSDPTTTLCGLREVGCHRRVLVVQVDCCDPLIPPRETRDVMPVLGTVAGNARTTDPPIGHVVAPGATQGDVGDPQDVHKYAGGISRPAPRDAWSCQGTPSTSRTVSCPELAGHLRDRTANSEWCSACFL